MSWKLARSLDQLRKQINEISPNRSKISDGTIGDPAHSARTSDHNPNGGRIVRAIDITHDPEHGIAGKDLANTLLASRDNRIKYIISDGEIASGPAGPSPWKWRKYKGANKHTKHMHLSVVKGKVGDDPRPWNLDLAVDAETAAKPVAAPVNPVLAKGTRGPDVERLQLLLKAHGADIEPDSDFGPKTEAAVKAFQRKHKLKPDGIVGPYTWDALNP